MRDLKYFDEGLGFVEFRENLNLNYFDEGLDRRFGRCWSFPEKIW